MSDTVPQDALTAALARADNAAREAVLGRLATILPALGDNLDAGEVLQRMEKSQPICAIDVLRPEFLVAEVRKVLAGSQTSPSREPAGKMDPATGLPDYAPLVCPGLSAEDYAKLSLSARLSLDTKWRALKNRPAEKPPEPPKLRSVVAAEAAAAEARRIRDNIESGRVPRHEIAAQTERFQIKARAAQRGGISI